MDSLLQRPALTFLTEDGKEKIHQTALKILAEIGMQVMHEEALDLLIHAGCTVDQQGRVKIPSVIVDKALRSAPGSIRIYDRNGEPAMDLGADRSYFGTGSDLLYSHDPGGSSRHRSLLQDVRRGALVCDALSNIDFIMSFAHPSDVPPRKAYLKGFQAMAESSTKPIVCTAEGRGDLEKIWEIALILRGAETEARSKPYFIHYAEPTSPLKHPFDSLDKLLFCAEKGIPVVYSPAPMAGATAPITIPGHVAQGLAECLCGLVIHQLKRRESPYIMGVGPAVMDMTTAQSSYNAPEYYLGYVAYVEMTHHYNLPSWGYAGTSDSQLPDEQASFEAGMCTLFSSLTGANLNHDVGYLDFGRTGSLEMIVLCDEMIGMMRRLRRGMSIDEEALAEDVIREAGLKGDYLSHAHTMKHFSDIQWRPALLNRKGYDRWKQGGSKTLLERARERLHKILETHQPLPIPAEKARAIAQLVERYEPL